MTDFAAAQALHGQDGATCGTDAVVHKSVYIAISNPRLIEVRGADDAIHRLRVHHARGAPHLAARCGRGHRGGMGQRLAEEERCAAGARSRANAGAERVLDGPRRTPAFEER